MILWFDNLRSLFKVYRAKCRKIRYVAVHRITAGHRSLSGTISCVTYRIRSLPVTMTGRFSNFNSISYIDDQHELGVTGTKCQLPDTMSGSRHFLPVTRNSSRSSVYDILLKLENLPVIVTGRKRILLVTYEILPDSDRWSAVISCTEILIQYFVVWTLDTP